MTIKTPYERHQETTSCGTYPEAFGRPAEQCLIEPQRGPKKGRPFSYLSRCSVFHCVSLCLFGFICVSLWAHPCARSCAAPAVLPKGKHVVDHGGWNNSKINNSKQNQNNNNMLPLTTVSSFFLLAVQYIREFS